MSLFLEVVKSLSDTRIDEDDGDDDDDLRERSSSSHTQQLLYSREYERALSLSLARSSGIIAGRAKVSPTLT